MTEDGRIPPTDGAPQVRVIDLGLRQRAIVEQLQRDEGYAAHLKRELAAAEERIVRGRAQLDLLGDLQREFEESIPDTTTPLRVAQ